MNYEELLNKAYENVVQSEEKERFELLPVEGRYAGNKTEIVNFGAIASHLRRQPEHLAKFLFRALATSGIIQGDRLVLDKKERRENVNFRIDKYAHEFVFCPSCGKPDTALEEENGETVLRCLACGHHSVVRKI